MKLPTAEGERLFLESFNRTLELYRGLVEQAGARTAELADTNLDLGRPTRAGEYSLADEAYAELLGKLRQGGFQNVSPGLRADLQAFYRDRPHPPADLQLLSTPPHP